MTSLTAPRLQAGELQPEGQAEVQPGSKFTHDPRAERTRQLIFTAIRSLIAQPTASVSVADIVRLAGISRSSFYAHFASLDVLAAELLQAQFADVGAAGLELPRAQSGQNASRLGYARLVAHMVENFPLYTSVLELPLTRSAHDQIIEAYATRMLASVLVFDDAANAELVTTYVAGGALTLIGAWMRGHLDVSDDELVDQLVALLPGWLLAPPTLYATPVRVASPTQN
ncbi:MAG: TetR/AcrR family transcriptional regulator [Cryobacterium sp.]|uniref:TetR/AcrR family transcriptional regulator n=1 Tax=unclassified Cryobacterium TaxID=2649013 RepID=UPI0018CA9F0B|nr:MULTISPECIES: TetR/AcrR family transcriptional regulator [unclassified Cryobacterium]MCY7403371.1 TetR/AcrR family transcriptional regulator [Cryobacterium sp.]MEC5153462.1 AcrR family transcriptional regulator [Cryobacterium sp. CAN_C3]